MRLLASASAAAFIGAALAVPAFAQETQGGGMERGADEITCREITAMDSALTPGVLYFIAGHRSGTAGAGAPPAAGQVVRMRGYFEIPVEQTLIACAAAPDRPASEVIESQRGTAGATGEAATSGGADAGGAVSGETEAGGAPGGESTGGGTAGGDATGGGATDGATTGGDASGGGTTGGGTGTTGGGN